MMELTAFDRSLLNLLQGNLPVCSRPFLELARCLSSDEDTVLNRVKYLREQGYLRRIGTFFDSAKLGYTGTLVAVEVEKESLPSVAEAINSQNGITHNYEREGKYNLWFTLFSKSTREEQEILNSIRQLPGVLAMMNLKSRKKYKINVQFKLA